MSERPLVDLVLTAVKLKAASPETYAELVECFRSIEKKAIAELLAGDQPHEIFRGQGVVKKIQEIRRHLQNCSQLRDTYVRRQDNARPNP